MMFSHEQIFLERVQNHVFKDKTHMRLMQANSVRLSARTRCLSATVSNITSELSKTVKKTSEMCGSGGYYFGGPMPILHRSPLYLRAASGRALRDPGER